MAADTPIEQLHGTLLQLAGDSDRFARTARLLHGGKTLIAKKLEEEAVATARKGWSLQQYRRPRFSPLARWWRGHTRCLDKYLVGRVVGCIAWSLAARSL